MRLAAALAVLLLAACAHGPSAKAQKSAEIHHDMALEVRPAYSEAHNNLGQLLARTGRYDEAIKEFDEALLSTFYREPWVARCNKGQALYRMGRRDDGLAELRTCLSIAPRYCAGRRELGRLLLSEGKLKEALEELTTAARDCDKSVDAHLQLGQARMKAGDLPGARASFERCVELAKGAPSGDECRRSLELLQ